MTLIIAGIIVSSLGLGYFIYGKRTQENAFLFIGLAMMVYPYFIGNIIVMLIIGAILAAGPFLLNHYF